MNGKKMINKSSVYSFMYVISCYNGTNKFRLLFYVRLEDMHSSGSLFPSAAGKLKALPHKKKDRKYYFFIRGKHFHKTNICH
ncbi:hypothetical protein Hanom_Chr10g00891261 [Helianthus anomalus]